MKTHFFSPSRPPQRGSALITVLLFSFLLLTLAASVMSWSLSERHLNRRSGYLLEARNAAEAVAEYGCYQVAQGFNQNMQPTFGTSGNTPVTFPSSVASSYFAGSHVATSSITLNVGAVRTVPSSGGNYYVDPADPNNTYDPLVGRYIHRQDVCILASATVTPVTGGEPPVTAYIEETVSVRGAPLLAYAIFYSGNDLEVDPLPLMDIYGPVHVNGNLFVGSVGSSPINFHGPVSTSGNIFHAWKGTTTTANEGFSGYASSNDVNFATNSALLSGGTLVSMKTSGGVWDDSTMGADSSTNGITALTALVTANRTTSFAQNASQTWKGNVQTVANGIQSYNPMGFTEIVAVDSSNNPILASNPVADLPATVFTPAEVATLTAKYGAGYVPGYGPHALIEPSLTPAPTDSYVPAKAAIETQKFANKAGLYITVSVNATNTATIKLYGDPRTTTGGASDGPNGGMLLGTVPTNIVNFIPYVVASNNTVTSGMYDQHQGVGVNLVQLNMGNLNTALTHMAATGNTTGTPGTDIVTAAGAGTTKWGATSSNQGYDPNNAGSTGWNGGIYVEVDNLYPSAHTSVILTNGTVASGNSIVPNNASGNPAPNGAVGLTVATNAPVYILGYFNADGTIGTNTTNSALYPDDTAAGGNMAASKETPVAIAGDSVTILSPNYFGTAPTPTTGNKTVPALNITSSAYSSKTTENPAASGWTEVAAAILSGSNSTSPTSTGTQSYSGGVHNMPRFLENWGSNTVAIRGSLISMYNNKVDTAAWGSAYYSPPNRQWGFDQIFANGKYPPMIPNVLSYRRVDFNYVSAANYASVLSGL